MNEIDKTKASAHTYLVRFKESYMPEAVERTCIVRSKQQIIDFYGLLEPDIEWFSILCVDDEETIPNK